MSKRDLQRRLGKAKFVEYEQFLVTTCVPPFNPPVSLGHWNRRRPKPRCKTAWLVALRCAGGFYDLTQGELESIESDESLDFVNLDANNSYDGCREGMMAWYPKLLAGGPLCGDDFRPAGGNREAAPPESGGVAEHEQVPLNYAMVDGQRSYVFLSRELMVWRRFFVERTGREPLLRDLPDTMRDKDELRRVLQKRLNMLSDGEQSRAEVRAKAKQSRQHQADGEN